MKRSERGMIIRFLIPAVLLYSGIFIYPCGRTFLMSFFNVPNVIDGMSKWKFVGLGNYIKLFTTQLFLRSLQNIFIILLLGGLIVIGIALIFAVVLHSGARWKSFWRDALYLPNVIPAVALAIMWIQYIYSPKFGLLKSMFNSVGLSGLANISWMSPQFSFQAMFIAYCFGCVGYYVIILLAGLEGIPADYYDFAKLEGANAWDILVKVSLPLIKNVMRICIVFWSAGALNFFIWSAMFSSTNALTYETISPVTYMYQSIFGQKTAVTDPTQMNAGIAAGVGVIITILVLLMFVIMNILIKEDKLADRVEY